MRNQTTRIFLGLAAAMLACAASDGQDWSTKGVQLYRAGRFAEAETAYRRALDVYDLTGQGASLPRMSRLRIIAARRPISRAWRGSRRYASSTPSDAREG